MRSNLKYVKSRSRYENSTQTNIVKLGKDLQALSYGWWKYLAVIDGHIVFNRYRYSISTQAHQRACLELLEKMGYKIDRFVEQRESL